MHYAPEVHLAFTSVEHIMRDVRGGATLRYIHANGASMFFIVVYIHMFRGLYYGSYFQPRANLWYSGIIIFFLMMATGFMGYVLPWGQMSFWGATVITNLFSAIPGIGNSIVQILWGGFSVDNPTLNRFFSLHYLLPFAIAGLAGLHLILLHQNGSNNPLGISSVIDRIPFYPYFYVKDLFGFLIFVLIFSLFVVYAPNYMGHPDNYIEANPLVTPAHIVPEWYFLPFYAILRTVPDKLGGVVLMVLAIFILALLPVLDTSSFRSNFFKPLNLWLFWYFFADSVSLGWIGQEIVESPFIEMGIFVTLSYFLYFIPLLPLIGFLENAVINTQLRQAGFINPIYSFGRVVSKHPIFGTDRIIFPDPSLVFGKAGEVLVPMSYYVEVFQLCFIVLFLFFLAIFFEKSGEFTRFINKISFMYFGIFLLLKAHARLDTWAVNDRCYNMKRHLFFWDEDAANFGNLFLNLFIVYAVIIVAIFFYGIADRYFISNSYEIEYPIIIFFILVGSIFFMSSTNLVDFVIAIEIVTLASYALTAFERKNRFSTYAGAQYFILGSVPSGLMILAVALIYRSWGTMVFHDLQLLLIEPSQKAGRVFPLNPVDKNFLPALGAVHDPRFDEFYNNIEMYEGYRESFTTFGGVEDWEVIYNVSTPYTTATVIAFFLLFVNFLFKITSAPFHFWAPSVYGKAPIASVTFLSIFFKAMVFFMMAKLLFTLFFIFNIVSAPFLIFCSVLSVFFGMIGAFAEKGIKRFFVYSSMGHVGFMLVSLSLSSFQGLTATFHYLPVYIITSFIMWFTLLHLGKEHNNIVHLKVLKNSDPMLAMVFALLIFSMSGIPPLGGFFVKLDVLAALLDSSRFYTNYILFFFTVASFFYYLRLVKIIFFDEEKEYSKPVAKNEERLKIISVLFLVLLFYLFIVQKPLLMMQAKALAILLH